jgi:hypothetical protein
MSEETLTEEEAKAAAEALKILSQSVQSEEEEGMSVWDAARLVFQGASFGYSDEIYGSIKGAIDPTMTAQEGRDEQRRLMADSYRTNPKSALAAEIGGAFIPGVALALPSGGGSLAVTAARGASIAPKVLKAAGIGGLEGFAYGTGTGEGGVIERSLGAGDEAAIGAVANPAVQKLASLLKPLFGKAFSKVRRNLAGRPIEPVESEIARIVIDAGVDIENEEAVAALLKSIADGGFVADISDNASNAVRALYAKGGPASTVIADALRKRAETMSADVKKSVQKGLAPEGSGDQNIFKIFTENTAKTLKKESDEYKRVFDEALPLGQNSAPLIVEFIEEIIKRDPSIADVLKRNARLRGMSPFFKIATAGSNKGKVTITRDLSLEDAEIIRREVFDRASRLAEAGENVNVKPIKELEQQLRAYLDELSPELGVVRDKWRHLRTMEDAFKIGNEAFKKSADEFEVMFDDFVQNLDMSNPKDLEILASLRLGFGNRMRDKFSTANLTGFTNKLANMDRKEALILSKIFPEDSVDELFKKIQLSATSNNVMNKILSGSQTAITTAGLERVGLGIGAGDLLRLASGDMLAGIGVARKVLGSFSKDMSDDQLEQVAKVIMSTDPAALRSALKDKKIMDKIVKRWTSAGRLVSGGLGSSGVVAVNAIVDRYVPFAEDFMAVNSGTLSEEDLKRGDVNLSTYPDIVRSGEMSPEEWNASIEAENPETGLPEEDIGALSSIITNIKPNARKKILDAARLS